MTTTMIHGGHTTSIPNFFCLSMDPMDPVCNSPRQQVILGFRECKNLFD